MEISDRLQCLFTAQLDDQNGSYVFEVPAQEVQLGDVDQGEFYRVAILPVPNDSEREESPTEPDNDTTLPSPPVDVGDTRDVEIESIGDQGDGVTRVERGFVVIVPDTEKGERVTIEITDVRENVAFAEVVARSSHFD